MPQKTVLITGCSQGGLGDALAQAFHRKGHIVIATARNPSKMAHFEALNIQTITLDVLSAQSISECKSTLTELTGGSLDILINNAGGGYWAALSDTSIIEARKTFDLNVWSALALTQSLLPLLRQSKHGGMVVNQTSVASVLSTPFAGIYNASKAAFAMLTDTLRLELAPFHIKVVELKTGYVRTNLFDNMGSPGEDLVMPETSMYTAIKASVRKAGFVGINTASAVDAATWAEGVVKKLDVENPSERIWKGGEVWTAWFASSFVPASLVGMVAARKSGLIGLRDGSLSDK
jgi:1-acylglycerone phosphate reductase